MGSGNDLAGDIVVITNEGIVLTLLGKKVGTQQPVGLISPPLALPSLLVNKYKKPFTCMST